MWSIIFSLFGRMKICADALASFSHCSVCEKCLSFRTEELEDQKLFWQKSQKWKISLKESINLWNIAEKQDGKR